MTQRWRTRAELVAAVIAGVVLYNLHPTRLGNALVAYKSLGAGESEGLSLEARLALYALDYRDGPQAWVHLAVFVAMVLCAIRTARLIRVGLRVGDR